MHCYQEMQHPSRIVGLSQQEAVTGVRIGHVSLIGYEIQYGDSAAVVALGLVYSRFLCSILYRDPKGID